MYNRQRAVAKRGAERLFLHLRNRNRFSGRGVIKVYYSERYPKRKCVIGVAAPINRELLAKVTAVGMGHLWCHHQPVIMNSWDSTQLRLMYRFRKINPNETKLVLKNARRIAEWMEEVFGMKAIVSPMKSLFGLRWRLRALI